MDGTIPAAIGQWLMDMGGTLLAWPGTFGYGILTGWFGPRIVQWIAKKMPRGK